MSHRHTMPGTAGNGVIENMVFKSLILNKGSPNKAMLSDKFFASLQICRRAKRYKLFIP